MHPFILLRSKAAQLTMVVVMTTRLPSGIAFAQTGERASTPTTQPAHPPTGARAEVWRALREFDRFLDHHPVLEDQLRLNSQLITNPGFLEKNPELRDYLRASPILAEGLKTYPRYFLNRALLREASAPLSYQDLAPFRDLLQREPGLERDLTRSPELVRDPAFLSANAGLRTLFTEHPALGRAFLPPDDSSPKP